MKRAQVFRLSMAHPGDLSALEKLIYIGKPTGERINLAEAMTEVPGAEASASLTTPPA